MKSVKILGTGCPKCKQSIERVIAVVNEDHLDVKVEKVEDIMEIMKYNVLSTPALVVDGEVKVKGRVPSPDEIRKYLKQ